MNQHRLKAYGFLLITAAIWGAAGPIIKYTLPDFPPLIFLAYRFGLCTIFTLLIWIFSPKSLPLPKSGTKIEHIILDGLLIVPVTLILLFFGFDRTSSLEGTLVSTVSPLMTVAAGAIFLHEHIPHREKLGIALAFFGTIIITVGPLIFSGYREAGSTLGNLLIVLAVVAETAGFLHAKVTLRESISPFTLTNFSFVLGFIVVAPMAIYWHGLPTVIKAVTYAPLSAHLGVWFMAFISGTFAYTLKNQAIKMIEVSAASVFSYLFPIFAAPLSIFWLGEKLTVYFWVGAIVISMGIILAEYKKSHHKPATRRAHRHTHR